MDAGGSMRELLRTRSDAIVAAIDGNARMVPVPPSVELHGHAAFTGQSGMDLVVPDDQIAVLDAWRRAQTESVVRSDVHLLADPGSTAGLWIFDLRAEHGVHVIVLEGQCLDAVHRSGEARDARRRIVARAKKDAVAVFLDADEATTRLLGWSRDDLVGRRTVDLVHPDDAEAAIDAWMRMRAGTPTGRVRVRLRHKHGHHVWVEITNDNRLEDPDFRCVLTEMVDISTEMAALEALHDRERLLGRLAEALPIGVCQVRMSREVAYSNEPLVALFGPVDSIDALVGQLVPCDRRSLEQSIVDAFDGRSTLVEVATLSARRCEISARPMSDGNGCVDGVVLCAADVTDRSRLRAELEHRASHDPLTGCLNREATIAALQRMLAFEEQVTVAFVDLDEFKAVNDALGHSAGDEVLRVVASRLRAAIRGGDVLGRLGGDEFTVICATGDWLDSVALADRLTTAIAGDVSFGDHRICLQASVGASTALAGELDAEGLLHRADAAMYAVKHRRAPSADRDVEPSWMR